MMSCTLFRNQITMGSVNHQIGDLGYNIYFDQSLDNGFTNIFTKKQLVLIEVAFEIKGTGYFSGDKKHDFLTEKEIERARIFGIGFGDHTKRLVAICKNIVKNKGFFIP